MRAILAAASLILGYGFYLLRGWYPDVPWIHIPALAVFLPVILTVACLLVILWPAKSGRGDPLARAWMSVSVAGCVYLVLLILARERQLVFDMARDQAFLEARSALKLELLRQAQVRKAEAADRAERAKSDRFVQYEGRIPDATLERLREIDREMQEEVAAQADKYTRAMELNPTKGPDDWVQFRTLDQLELERTHHQALYEQTRAFTQYIESFEDKYSSRIKSSTLEPPADRIAIAEMERILQYWEHSRLYDLRLLDVELLATSLKLLDILRDSWGNWNYNPRERQVTFADPQRQAAFEQLVLQMKAILAELKTIRENADPSDSQ